MADATTSGVTGKVRRFILKEYGDPFARNTWEIIEWEKSELCRSRIYRGDLGPIRGLRRAVYLLRRLYPGCKFRVER